MTENSDKSKEVARNWNADVPSEVIQKGGVIADCGAQARWQRTQDAHKLDQLESATDLYYDPNWKKPSTEKFELFDSECPEPAESVSPVSSSSVDGPNQVLIAGHVGLPSDFNIKAAQDALQFSDVKSDSDVLNAEAIMAKGIYQDVRDSLGKSQIVRVAQPIDSELLMRQLEKPIFPFRGEEDEKLAECTKANPKAWSDALEKFSELKEYLPGDEGVRLMRSLVRNELHNYDLKDRAGDNAAKEGKASSETLGFAQITPIGVKSFERDYPALAEFLKGKGHAGQEAKALEDPSCVPMIVAAKLQSEVDVLKKSTDKVRHGQAIDINFRSLAYSYNADVYFNPNDRSHPDFHANVVPKAHDLEKLRGYVKAFPTSDERVLKCSSHLANVEAQLRFLR